MSKTKISRIANICARAICKKVEDDFGGQLSLDTCMKITEAVQLAINLSKKKIK